MNIPSGFDPITLYQWLWFKYRCQESSASEFQKLFEDIFKRHKPEFMQIRPYGNIGDRKVDGLLRADASVFQVYSPDAFTQSELLKKIHDDLDGAVSHWGDSIKNWTFVYNVRRGLAPDIAGVLNEKGKKYPQIKIEHLSNDGLWEILRSLTPQQRAEILGAPMGYEKIFLSSSNDVKNNPIAEAKDGWIVLIQDVLSPIDIHEVLTALHPSPIFGAPIYLRPDINVWEDGAFYQKNVILDLLEKCRNSSPPRFAVFSIAPIPLITHLGFLLTNNVSTKYFKLHVDTNSWSWPKENIDTKIHVSGVPDEPVDLECEVVLRISLSDEISPIETDEIVQNISIQIDIFVDHPSLDWIQSQTQVKEFALVFRETLTKIRRKVKRCKRIHLFMAVAAPIALIAGQEINPRMNAPISLYHYNRNSNPRHQFAFTLD